MRWTQLQGFQGADAEDLAQIVLVKLIRLLPGYERRDGRTFRGWLFTICRNEGRDFRARPSTRALPGPDGLPTVAVPPASKDPDEGEYRRHLVRRALELVRPDFAPATWTAFSRFVLDGRPAPDVARELGVSANAVYLARNRVPTRVREELAGLLDRPRFEAMSFARYGQKARDSHDPIHAARDLRAGVRAARRVRGRGRPAQ